MDKSRMASFLPNAGAQECSGLENPLTQEFAAAGFGVQEPDIPSAQA